MEIKMDKYIETKIIAAREMTLGEYNEFKGWTIQENECPNREGYLKWYSSDNPNLEHSEDYVTWSPKEVFVETHCPITDMPFGHTIEASKIGFKVARRDWKRGTFVYYVPENKYATVTAIAKEVFGAYAAYNPYLAIKRADGTVSVYTPSTDDCLAEDWCIVN